MQFCPPLHTRIPILYICKALPPQFLIDMYFSIWLVIWYTEWHSYYKNFSAALVRYKKNNTLIMSCFQEEGRESFTNSQTKLFQKYLNYHWLCHSTLLVHVYNLITSYILTNFLLLFFSCNFFENDPIVKHWLFCLRYIFLISNNCIGKDNICMGIKFSHSYTCMHTHTHTIWIRIFYSYI